MKKKILHLKPTQFSLGMKDVDDKIKRIKTRSKRSPHKEVPVVRGPGGKLYIIDNHHYVRAMWECGKIHVNVKVVANYSKLSMSAFWKAMIKMKWCFLYDQLGSGPHRPQDLPECIRSMANNPWRSLAWKVREAAGYEKSPVPFAEFFWAEFFRKGMKNIDPLAKNAIPAALKLCTSKKARRLPGFKVT